MSCILRVSGESLNIDSLLSQIDLLPEHSWRKGEPRIIKNRVHTDSGANFLVSNAEFNDISRKVVDATNYLESHSSEIKKISAFPGVQMFSLDFAVALNEGYVSQHTFLPVKFILAAAAGGVSVEISHYACNENEN